MLRVELFRSVLKLLMSVSHVSRISRTDLARHASVSRYVTSTEYQLIVLTIVMYTNIDRGRPIHSIAEHHSVNIVARTNDLELLLDSRIR
jgi:hypothetical protein